MRVIDIIDEAKRRRSRSRPPSSTPPTPPSTPSRTGPDPATRAERIKRRDELRSRKKLAKEMKDIRGFIAKWTGDIVFMGRMKPMRETAYKGFKNTARLVRYFQIWGYYELFDSYCQDKAVLQALHDMPEDDPDYEEGHLSDEELAYYQRLLAEETVLKIGASSAFPALIRGFLMIVTGGRLLFILGSGAATMGWGTLAAFAATEVGMLAFQHWINSTESGKAAIKWTLMNCFDPVVEYAWQKGPIQIISFLKGVPKDEADLPPKPPGRDVNLNNLKTDNPNSAGQNQQPEKDQSQSKPSSKTSTNPNMPSNNLDQEWLDKLNKL